MKKLFTLIATALVAMTTNAQQSWDFTNMSDADKTALRADDSNWTESTSDARFEGKNDWGKVEDFVLTSNGTTVIEFTKGLTFNRKGKTSSTLSASNIRLNYGKSAGKGSLQFSSADIDLNIPNLKKGQTVTVKYKTNSSGNADRYLSAAENLTVVKGFAELTAVEDVEAEATVNENGKVVFRTVNGGVNIYSITVTGSGEEITYSSGSKSWDFLTLSSADETALAADNTNWTHEATSSENRYNSNAVYGGTNIALEANGTELEYTKGLLFTFAKQANKIRLNWNKATSGLQLNGKDIVLTIPNLAKGTKISMGVRTGKSGEARGFTVGNFTKDNGVELVVDGAWTISGEAAENGSVTFTTTVGGMNVIRLAVGDAATGIQTVSTVKADGKIYNLAGMEIVTPPAKGIYIKNGKKFIVK